MKHLTHLHEQVESRRNRVKNTAFMNELREQQQTHTYKLFYDRLRNALSNSATPHETKEVLQRRLNTPNN
jgi:hypothetical protein